MGEKLKHFVLYQNALLVLIVFKQFVVEGNQFWVSQVKQLLCVKLQRRSLIFLPASSELGLRILMKCLPLAFAVWLLSLLFAAVHIDPK